MGRDILLIIRWINSRLVKIAKLLSHDSVAPSQVMAIAHKYNIYNATDTKHFVETAS